MRDGYVYRFTEPRRATGSGERTAGMPGEIGLDADMDIPTSWPVPPTQRLVSRANSDSLRAELEPGTVLGPEPWVQVETMDEVINIYDLGFWHNLMDAFRVQ